MVGFEVFVFGENVFMVVDVVLLVVFGLVLVWEVGIGVCEGVIIS